ncbi:MULTISPECIES: TetR/AcrR family transcriptional regulator [unclassified Leifsonia]|uniref:TetR/AcrR family transcriptional regulator n=1 Tax=unclassified Leifsonia TaxID=2663824 RepID=UPI0006F83C4E|nr:MULTISPECIES: TetR/AcrR family transcriptional regulator [unclassified Leifsonia]KQX07426.1 hypothetical protein ASC59_06590 [Leifsonia sp. Root1293]KRA11708.1 hypothetical protein ASD61_06590 [Leifsonia sp. Root60]
MTFSAPFHRARSDEQRAERRQAILDAAAGILAESRVPELSLTALAHRVGLAKSNVLRYFDSREAVLLELYDREFRAWLADLGALADADPRGAASVDGLATMIATTAVARPVFCDLCASAAVVLERNVSVQAAAAYKHSSIDTAHQLAQFARPALGENGDAAALAFAGGTVIVIGGLWAASQPSPAMAEAYAADPALAAMRIDLGVGIRELVATLITGLRERAPHLD